MAKKGKDGGGALSIHWPVKPVTSIRREKAVRHVLHRKGDGICRGRDLPPERLEQITRTSDKNGMTLYQALSLRRTMLRTFRNGMSRVNHAMGSSQGQQDVAGLLEDAVVSFLEQKVKQADSGKSCHDVFRTEAQLLAEMKKKTRPRGPTPDILFLEPITINGQSVKWIDAKMFYGSALFATNQPKIPNGKIAAMAQRYTTYYGGMKGAFVFGRGFCADLTPLVPNALLLDASPLSMTAIEAFQDANH